MGGVNSRTRAFVSIGEGAAGGPDAGKFLGAARYTLHNVAPRDGGVDIWVNIEWSSDIGIYVDYLVVNLELKMSKSRQQQRLKRGQA